MPVIFFMFPIFNISYEETRSNICIVSIHITSQEASGAKEAEVMSMQS